MAKFRNIQNNFLSGELSPKYLGRTETPQYATGAEELKNNIVRPQGGILRRPGTQFCASEAVQRRLTDGTSLNGGSPVAFTGNARIFPFIFSKEESYIFVMKADGADSSISIFNTATKAEAVFSVETQQISNADVDDRFDGYVDEDELHEVQFAQNGDLLFFVHPEHPPYIIARTATDTFERFEHFHPPQFPGALVLSAGVDFYRNFPFLDKNVVSTTTIAVTGTFPSVTLTASSAIFQAAHIGSVIKIDDPGGALTSVATITAFTSSTIVSAEIFLGPTPIAATSSFAFGAWSGVQKYPRSVSFFEQRIYYGGTEKQPDTVYGSQIGDIFQLDSIGIQQDAGFGTLTNADAFTFTVSSVEVNQIQWLSPGKTLNIGTLGREYISQGAQGAMGPLDIVVSPETSFGSTFVQPVRAQNTIVFPQRSGTQIREFFFNRDENAFRAQDISLLAEHMFRKQFELLSNPVVPQLRTIVFQASNKQIIWMTDTNGGLFAVTRDRQEGINAWHFHQVAGTLNSDPSFIHSVAITPSQDGDYDDLYVAVERTVDSSDVIYIEKMGKEFEREDFNNTSTSINDKPIYMDSAVLFQVASFPAGTPTTTVTGLAHLEGESVQVIADGFFVGEKTVSSGSITLDDVAQEAIVGLSYESRLVTLQVEAGSSIGTSQSAIKRIERLTLRLLRSLGIEFGRFDDDGSEVIEELELRPANLAMDTPIPFFTGDKLLDFQGDYQREGKVIIKQTLPWPVNLNALIIRAQEYD